MPLLQLLLKSGASATHVDAENRTAATWARLTGHDLAAAFLDGTASGSAVLSDGSAADAKLSVSLNDASFDGDLPSVVALLDDGVAIDTREDQSVLHIQMLFFFGKLSEVSVHARGPLEAV